MAASLLLQIGALLRSGRHGEAAQRLTGAAAAGDREAAAELARWRIAGTIVRRDLTAARALLAQAGGAGDDESARLHAYFLAAGVGGEADWRQARTELAALAARDAGAAAQIALIEAMDLGAAIATETLSERPHVVAAPGFATAAECDWLVRAAEPDLQPATVVDPATGRLIPHPVRVSDGATFGVFTEDLVVNAINRRIAALSGTALDQGEPLQLLRYRPGGEYRAHMDALPAEPNQRIATALVYLSDDYEGGETQFLRTGLAFRGRKGDALLFRNVTDDGRPDPMALHAGRPVTRGVKAIASRWIRAARFSYPPPRPLVDR
ncbi:MAG: 2OG-Fe(II) oxygenase [Allosphingosinicella sp.]